MRYVVPDGFRVSIPLTRACICALGLASSIGLGCKPTELGPPDVLLITIDTLRADYLGTYGFDHETSPEIDRLARQGVVFERAIAASGRTVPSHAAILTSRYTREHSVGFKNGNTSLRDAKTLAQHFKEAGYATGAFTSNILLTAVTGFAESFDVYDSRLHKSEGDSARFVERIAEATTKSAIEWLERTSEQPVFMWVHYQDPHGPYRPPPHLEDRFILPRAPDERPIPMSRVPEYQRLPDVRYLNEYKGRYAGEIYYADQWVGELVGAFDERMPGRSGIVLLTADHGESFGETPQFLGHTLSSTPNVAHVPMVLRAPGISPGRRREIVHHVDILPTLLDLAGLGVPSGISGLPLGPVLRGSQELPDRYVYCDNGIELGAYRNDELILVRHAAGAWEAMGAGGRPRMMRRPEWDRYVWSSTSKWSSVTDGSQPVESLPDRVSSYMKSAIPMFARSPLSDERKEQLRALGYFDLD